MCRSSSRYSAKCHLGPNFVDDLGPDDTDDTDYVRDISYACEHQQGTIPFYVRCLQRRLHSRYIKQ